MATVWFSWPAVLSSWPFPFAFGGIWPTRDQHDYGKGPGRWSLALLVIAAISGSSYGWSGLNASSRYALGLTGAWATTPLWGLASSPTALFRPWLRTGSVCLLLYGVATGIIVSPAPFFPGSLVNTATFLQVTGLPIQLLRGFLVLGVAAMAFVILSL